MQFLDAEEEDEAADGSPEVNDKDAEALGSEEAPTVTVERSVRSGKQTCHQCAEYTTDTMHRTGTHGIVDVQHVVDELNAEDEHRTANEADEDGSDRRNEVATGCDAYETSQHTVQRQGERRLLIFQPREKHRGYTASCCCQVSGQEDVADGYTVDSTAGCELRAGVEAKPT